MYAMHAAPGLGDADLSSLTRCTVGGQTIPMSTASRWQARSAAPLIGLWGMTEISGLARPTRLYAPAVPGSTGVSLPVSRCGSWTCRTSARTRRSVPGRAHGPGPAREAAHHLPERALVEPAAAGGGQQRPAELPGARSADVAVRAEPVEQVRVERGRGGRWEHDGGHPCRSGQHAVAAVVAEVGQVGAGALVDTQAQVQQQPGGGRGAQPGSSGIGIGGGNERAG